MMCEHYRDPENMVRQLVLAAMNNPERLGDLLDCADCPGCARQVLEKFTFTFAGYVQDSVDKAEDASPDDMACTCERLLPAEARAMRLVLAYAAMGFSDDGATLRDALVDAAQCPACVLDVLVALARAQVGLLNGSRLSWRPDNEIGVFEKQLLSVLDEADRG